MLALGVHGGIAALLLAGTIAAPKPQPDPLPVFEIVIPAAPPQLLTAPAEPAPPEPVAELPEPDTEPLPEPQIESPAPAKPAVKPRPRPPQQAVQPRGETPSTNQALGAADSLPVQAPPIAARALPQAPVPVQEAMPPYAPILLDWLGRHRDYPRAARLRRLEGAPRIALTLDRSGRLIALTLVQSSGIPLLDEAALAMARRAAPFPPPQLPPGSEKASFIVPVRFALEP
ncbi:MAG: TonB family protein [Ferrovibrio sp.]|uniref:TonB family protein n=1 Tax=Ferrovibrio sp. TaxID=1917215 RepID=UPI0026181899|nr:TonB family protein [Ferrovibrio sp.]MCW0235988.1 TonB family protein [Ferrovibrio sp.]